MKAKSPAKNSTVADVPGTFVLVWLFFGSGALALVYEIIWQRQFALIFGAAAPATAAVLAAYFAGLGTGSYFIGNRAKRWLRPLRSYALLEIFIGVGALLVSPILIGFEAVYPWLFERLAGNSGVFFAVKTLLVFIALALPTFCMGGTLPVLGQLVDQGQHRLGVTAGRLYVANTVGAGMGALLVPFLLLPLLGAQGALWVCVGGNFGLAFIAWRMDQKLPTASPQSVPDKPRTQSSSSIKLQNSRAPLVLAAISGVVTFALQVFWNRAFAQVHENSVYSFAVMVAVIIFALALGAQLARVALQRRIAPAKLIGGAWILGGLCLAIGPWLFLELTNGLDYLPSREAWTHYALRLVGLILVVLFVPVTLLGIGLPAIMEQAGQRRDTATSQLLGNILAANVAGSVLGALAAGFVLPRWLGQWNNILMLAVLLILAGYWQWQSEKKSTNPQKLFITLIIVFLGSLWPISKINLPRVRYASEQGERLISVSEGTHGVTAVIEKPGSRRLKLNNFYVLGGTSAAGDERMQTHLPLLVHPQPERVAMLGLGTGITASGAMFHPVKRLVAVELVPDVVKAARDYFSDANAGVMISPRTQVVVEDARNYLRGTREKFDVIIGDLVVPWRQGEGALFTLEHFQAARAALAPNGIFCQWLPLFQLSETELQIILRTYLTVFPEATIWRGDFSPTEPAIALISGRESFTVDPAVVRARLKAMQADPFNPHLASPTAFWMHYVGPITTQNLSATETRINRENQPWVELLGPLQHAGGRSGVLFVGRRLQVWLTQLKQSSTNQLAGLSADELKGIQAADMLAELMLRMAENDAAGARLAQEQLRQTLPAEVFALLFPGM